MNMVKAKPFEVQTQHGTLSTSMLISNRNGFKMNN